MSDCNFGKRTFGQNQIQVLDHPLYSPTKALNLPDESPWSTWGWSDNSTEQTWKINASNVSRYDRANETHVLGKVTTLTATV